MSYGSSRMRPVWNNHVMGIINNMVSLRIKNHAQQWSLATLQNNSMPRACVNLGAAAHIADRIAHTLIMIVNMSNALPT